MTSTASPQTVTSLPEPPEPSLNPKSPVDKSPKEVINRFSPGPGTVINRFPAIFLCTRRARARSGNQ